MVKHSELESPVDRPFFIAGYLTLVSVIQATAFGLFVISVGKLLINNTIGPQIPFLVCEYFIIVNVTFGYFAGTRDLRWHFGPLDILVPFTIGLAECLAINTLGQGSQPEELWFGSFLLLFATGILAVLNASYKVRIFKDEYPKAERQFHYRNQLIFGIICLGMTFMFTVLVILIHRGLISLDMQKILAWVLSAIYASMFFLTYCLDWKKSFLTRPSTATE